MRCSRSVSSRLWFHSRHPLSRSWPIIALIAAWGVFKSLWAYNPEQAMNHPLAFALLIPFSAGFIVQCGLHSLVDSGSAPVPADGRIGFVPHAASAPDPDRGARRFLSQYD
jgi:hypothetical protein